MSVMYLLTYKMPRLALRNCPSSYCTRLFYSKRWSEAAFYTGVYSRQDRDCHGRTTAGDSRAVLCEGPFGAWATHFHNVAALNSWTEEQQLQWLTVRLVGRAQITF